MMKKAIALIALVLLPLAGCQAVADARSTVCTTLRNTAQGVLDLGESIKTSKPVATVGDLRARIRTVKQTLETVRTVSQTLNNGGTTLDLIRALDDLEKSTEGMADTTPLSQVADKLAAPAAQVKTAYDNTMNAICAAK
jgi:PBP1b-binding outer membrane lipoprotein LpoB